MTKTTSETRRRTAGRSLLPVLTILLVLSLLAMTLLSGCNQDPAPSDTPAQSTPATAAPDTEAPTDAASLTTLPETLPAETAGPETEPPAATLPADWTPTLNRTDISFFGAGESFVLTVPGAVGVEVLWSAEDEEIAAVDETGRVTAVGPGSARVFAEVADTRLECWIRCQFDAPPAEDALSLNNTDISFFGVGESYRLSVNNAPDGAEIVWSSEDYGVAAVDANGRVRAVGPGTIRVKARIGETVLSCWVRCQFEAPAVPRSSVADGSWRVTLHKDDVTVQDEEAGIMLVQAEILSRIQVAPEELEGLETYDRLDLSRFGLGSFRVSSIAFNGDKTSCTLTADDAVLLFSLENGLWTLVDADGEAQYYSSGTGRFVFDGDTHVYEQRGWNADTLDRYADVLALFDQHPGFEETVTPVCLTVSDGFVTEAIWIYLD